MDGTLVYYIFILKSLVFQLFIRHTLYAYAGIFWSTDSSPVKKQNEIRRLFNEYACFLCKV